MAHEETQLVASLSTKEMGNSDDDGNNFISRDTIAMDDDGGKMSPEERQKIPKR